VGEVFAPAIEECIRAVTTPLPAVGARLQNRIKGPFCLRAGLELQPEGAGAPPESR